MNAEARPVTVPDPVGDRYGSLALMPWWKQECVRNATAMVVGAGALGNEVLKALAMVGLGRILIVDFDVVEQGDLPLGPLPARRRRAAQGAVAATASPR